MVLNTKEIVVLREMVLSLISWTHVESHKVKIQQEAEFPAIGNVKYEALAVLQYKDTWFVVLKLQDYVYVCGVTDVMRTALVCLFTQKAFKYEREQV